MNFSDTPSLYPKDVTEAVFREIVCELNNMVNEHGKDL